MKREKIANDFSFHFITNLLYFSTQLKTILQLSGELLHEGDFQYNDAECDKLLQQFHRFDENIGAIGKWQGGSVTAVCRGWGTTKFLSFEAIYQIADKTLFNLRELVDECIEDELDDFNEKLENYTVPDYPCDGYIPDSSLVKPEKKNEIIEDVKEKLECLHASYDLSHTYEKFSIQEVLKDYFEAFKTCATSLPQPFEDTFNDVKRGLDNCTSSFDDFQSSFVTTMKTRVKSCLNEFKDLSSDEKFAVDVVLPTPLDESIDNLAEIFTALLMDLKESGVSLDNFQKIVNNTTESDDGIAKGADISDCGIDISCIATEFKNAITTVTNKASSAVTKATSAVTKATSALTKVDRVINNCFNVTGIVQDISDAFDDMKDAFDKLGDCFTGDGGLQRSIQAFEDFPDRALETFTACASGFTEVTEELLELPEKTVTAFQKCSLSGMYPKSPIFAAKANAFGSFNYETPVELIEYKKRMKPGKKDKKYGKLAIDTIPEYLLFDTVAEAFMFDVYEEFIGCAVR